MDDAELGIFLSHIVNQNNNKIYFDEYGEVISSYQELFSNIWEQYNETLCENYAVKQFEKDRLDLCSSAKFLSHQLGVKDTRKIMKRMGKALKYRCDPCMPYKRNDNFTVVTSITTIINGINESPDDNGNVCKDPSITGKHQSISSSFMFSFLTYFIYSNFFRELWGMQIFKRIRSM